MSTTQPRELPGLGTVPRKAGLRSVLMCRPDYFSVVDRSNLWMDPRAPTDTELAVRQWNGLYELYRNLGFAVHLIDPIPGLPDMVYAANGALVIDNVAYGARFRHRERRPEGPAYLGWLEANGFAAAEPASTNEGEGDFLLVGDRILAGTGFRSAADSHVEVGRVFGREVVTLRLIDPRFYHLDTAIAVLDSTPGHEDIAYLPEAFDDESRRILAAAYPDAILVSEQDASVLGLNAFSDGLNVVIASRAADFGRRLRERGYRPIGVDLSELLLGGGGAKCCTLELRR